MHNFYSNEKKKTFLVLKFKEEEKSKQHVLEIQLSNYATRFADRLPRRNPVQKLSSDTK